MASPHNPIWRRLRFAPVTAIVSIVFQDRAHQSEGDDIMSPPASSLTGLDR